jgi:hypothetical protein
MSAKIGDQVYINERGMVFGAVRGVHADGLDIYVENAGDFQVRMDVVKAVHDGKVVLDLKKLDGKIRAAIGHAHEQETP